MKPTFRQRIKNNSSERAVTTSSRSSTPHLRLQRRAVAASLRSNLASATLWRMGYASGGFRPVTIVKASFSVSIEWRFLRRARASVVWIEVSIGVSLFSPFNTYPAGCEQFCRLNFFVWLPLDTDLRKFALDFLSWI